MNKALFYLLAYFTISSTFAAVIVGGGTGGRGGSEGSSDTNDERPITSVSGF
ncbi:MAG: hypothetical protein NE328_18820 [Lentisphaeraceae bacterium]|nr:hypothetical protein [Lentisphaeraceae bacterium]